MKKIPVLYTLLFLFINNFLTANPNSIYSASSIPAELKENAHTVIRYEKTTFEVTNIHKATIHYKTIITLLNKKSSASDIVVFYDKVFEKVQFGNIKIYDANGKMIDKIKSKEITDHSSYSGGMFDDGRYKHADGSHSEYPYTIEYEYSKTTSRTMFYPDWYITRDFEISVEKSDYELITPLDIQVRHKICNIDLPISESLEGKKRFYKMTATNISAFVKEPVRPINDKILPHIFFAPNKFALGEYEGDMSSWESLGKFNYELNKGRDELSAEMKKKVGELVSNAATKEEKITILYHYLQENMRYVSIQLGIGGWQTFDAKYVERNKYGDCKALTNFMKSMLTEAKITAYPALIRNGNKTYDLSKDFSSPDFNHVVLYIPDAGDNGIWLECTSSDLPPKVIGSSNENRYALLVKPEGGELIRTPVSTKDDNLLISNINIKIDQDGTAKIKAEQKATGRQDMMFRYYALNESDEEIKKIFRNNFSLPSFKIKDFKLLPSKKTPETEIMLDLEVPKYASKGGKRMFISPNPINQLSYVPREVTDRKLPIERNYAYSDVDIVIIEIPNGYEIESIPQEKLIIENDFGKYAIKFEQKNNQLIYTRTMESKSFSFPKERYNDYRAFLKEVTKADKMKVVLVRNQP